MPKATDHAINRDDTDVEDRDSALDEGATLPHVAGVAARMAGLELDAGTLEMVMAALTADVCDQVDAGPAT
jgi:hypothetical protein